jgi:phage terminase large subunit-like protein
MVADGALLAQWRATKDARALPLRKWARQCVGPAWQPARHLETLYDLFELAEREPVFACISMPPGHAKTETTLAALSWLSARNPMRLNGYVSYSSGATRAKSLKARDFAQTLGLIPSEDLWSASEWRSVVGGGCIAAGRGGRLTGDRITGVLVVDDPFKSDIDAASATIRELVSSWFDSVAYPRLDPSASCIVIHTRWNLDDLIGRLRAVVDAEGRKLWREIRLPAIDDSGRPLWPEAYPLDILARKRAQLDARNPHLWPALYQQQPVPRGGKLFRDPARYLTADLPRGLRELIGADLAATAKKSGDSTAAMRIGYKGAAEALTAWELELQQWQLEAPDASLELRRMQVAAGGIPLALEVNGLGKPIVQAFRRAHPKAHVIEITRASDKYTAAIGAATAWNAGRYLVPLAAPWAEAHMARARAFTGLPGGDDDDIDAAVNAFEAAGSGGTGSGAVTV